MIWYDPFIEDNLSKDRLKPNIDYTVMFLMLVSSLEFILYAETFVSE